LCISAFAAYKKATKHKYYRTVDEPHQRINKTTPPIKKISAIARFT
jgi:hypothetical protein